MELPFFLQVLPARNPVYRILNKHKEFLFRTNDSLYAAFTRQKVTKHRVWIKRSVGPLNGFGKLGRVRGREDDLNCRGGAVTDITESSVQYSKNGSRDVLGFCKHFRGM